MRRRRARRRRMILGAAAAVILVAIGSTLIYWTLPQTRLGRALDSAASYMNATDYVQAREAYEEALQIDDSSELAYRGLADDYMAQGMTQQAREALLQGYEATGSQVLLQNYTATVLNGVVERINDGTADLQVLGQCLDVLEIAPQDQDALNLLSEGAKRVLTDGEQSDILLDGLDGSETFSQYQTFVQRLLSLAEASPADYLPAVEACCVIQAPSVYLSLSHAQDYRAILERAQALGASQADQLLACLDVQADMSAYFAPMFEQFEAGNFEAAKDFIVTQDYAAIRDQFISGTMKYWYGHSYIPVTKEAIVFLQTDGGWMFSYVENDGLARPTGTIRILGQTMLDLGVQRNCIEYVPQYEPGSYYPHTEYEIVYWNTMVSGIATDNTNVVSRMNYRFAEKIYTAEGMEARMIYDWGGPNEKRQTE